MIGRTLAAKEFATSVNARRFLPVLAGLVPRYLTSRDFRIQIESITKNDQRRCFIDEIMTHERLSFEKGA